MCCLVCDRPVYLRGYCRPHYERLWKYGDPLAGGTYVGEPQAFIDRLLEEQPAECVIWPFGTKSDGYGQIKLDGKSVVVSRLLCGIVHGEPPDSTMEAAHKCGNGARGCVNPKCLYWATKAENEADKRRHGTILRGEKNGNCKLTDPQADDIRRDTRPVKVIASDYGINRSHVYRIKSGVNRSFIKEEAQAWPQ